MSVESGGIVILRAAGYRAIPWRNGGGTTREIAVEPTASGFAWRLTLASITRAGPFSSFPDTDRYLMLADGKGLDLAIEGLGTRHLAPGDSLRFPGEAAVQARLDHGPCRVLNLMVDRRAARIVTAEINSVHASDLAGPCLIFVLDGPVGVADAGRPAERLAAERFDVVRVSDGARCRLTEPDATGRILFLAIDRLSTPVPRTG